MWICRHCAAHVKDDVLKCPSCATLVPARLQPELANNVSDEMKEAPRSEQIHWLSLKALPNLRKQAQSPWVWALFGFVVGLGYVTINFRGSLAQPFLCGGALAVVFGLLGAVLRWRRRCGNGHIYPAEVGAIFGFFLPIILVVIDEFANRQGWENPGSLFGGLLLAGGGGIFLAAFAAIASGAIVPIWQVITGALGWRSHRKGPRHKIPPRVAQTKTDSRGHPLSSESTASTIIISAEKPPSSSEQAGPQGSPSPPDEGGWEDLEDIFPERKKPVAWLPSFDGRSIIKGEGLFRFSAQVVVLLVVAVMILALLAAMGISTPASNGLAILFGLIIWMWVMGVLIWGLFGFLIRKVSGPTQPHANRADTEDIPINAGSSPDLAKTYSIQTKPDGGQFAADSLEGKVNIKPEDTGN